MNPLNIEPVAPGIINTYPTKFNEGKRNCGPNPIKIGGRVIKDQIVVPFPLFSSQPAVLSQSIYLVKEHDMADATGG